MIMQKQGKVKLNIEKAVKSQQIVASTDDSIKGMSLVDKFMKKNYLQSSKFSLFNENTAEINNTATKVFNQIGLAVNDLKQDPLAHTSVLRRVNLYLTRFPEVEYLIDMISSSVIYSSSSNTKKIQFILNGEYKVLNTTPKQSMDTTTSDGTVAESTLDVQLSDVNVNSEMEKVDSWYQNLNLDVGNLFKKNNIKLSLYGLMSSITKYGCGLFYVYDTVK